MLPTKSKLVFLAALLVSVGCTANSPTEKSATFKSTARDQCSIAVDEIAEAEKARKKAASVKGEWRDTAKFIKKAQDLVKKSKCNKAVKLAKKASKQGELGYQQAINQQELKMPGYFKF